MIEFLLFFMWSLPQNIAGELIYSTYKLANSIISEEVIDSVRVSYIKADDYFGNSIGNDIFLSELYKEERAEVTLLHEIGHTTIQKTWTSLCFVCGYSFRISSNAFKVRQRLGRFLLS